jgi:hypothetical protein
LASSLGDLDVVMQGLAEVRSVRADYVETLEMSLLEQRLTTRGTLSYEAPDRITKTSASDPEQAVRFEGDTLWVSDGKETRRLSVQDHRALETLVVALRATFAGDLATLREHFHLSFQRADPDWSLELRPREAGLGGPFSSVELRGRGREIRVVRIHEANGDLRSMRLRVIQIDPPASP